MSVLFAKNLRRWYRRNGRKLPWRTTKDPYAIWISEIMLQQTQVSRVKDFYLEFMARFPNVKELAKASWEEVLEYWRGLGYYRRARHIHAAAQIVANERGGVFPNTWEELRKLPGIGHYTASAIMSFAYGKPYVALDTNLKRVFERFFGEEWRKLTPARQLALATSLVPKASADIFNHALMDLGSALCLVREPNCNACPLRSGCRFTEDYSRGASVQRLSRAYQLADRSPKNLVKVAVGVVIRDGKVLISKRRDGVAFGGFWEFPGGKLHEGEDERACLKRELQEELGIEVAVRPPFYKVQTTHEGQLLQLTFHRCSVLLGEPRALQVQEFQWIKPEELFNFTFPPVNTHVIELLLKKKAMFRI